MRSEIFKTTTDEPLIEITRLHTHHQTSRPGLGLYSAHRSRPEILSPQLAPRWLRSRLSTDDDELNNTLLRVSWWQPLPMRVFPLSFMPKRLSYRIDCGPYKGRCNTAHWWRQTSIRRPSNRQISQAYGDCQLVYLRTTNVYSALDKKSHLRQHPLYQHFSVFAILPFAKDVWEVLVNRQGANHFKACAEAYRCVIKRKYQPGLPIEIPLTFVGRFDSHIRVQERLIARAVSLRVIARDGQQSHSQLASVYSRLVDLYCCYNVYENLYTNQVAQVIEALSPEWSCVVGCYSSMVL